jgi:Protein of unknown function (DUF3108)
MLRINLKYLLVFSACLLSVAGNIYADDYIAPDAVHVTTPTYHPEFSDFKQSLGTYNYTTSWEGIPAASLSANVEQNGLQYRVVVTAKTYKMIDIVYKLRYRAEGVMSAVDFYPIKNTVEHKENSRDRYTEINFLPDGEVEAIRIDRKKDETKTLKFEPNNFMLDPFSAAFLARTLNWEKGAVKQFDTFNGKSRYLITLTAEDKVQMEINNEMRDVWVIVPVVKNLTYPEQTKKLRRAEIYVTADKYRDILKIVSSVFIGSVTTKLDSFEPSDKPEPGTSVARARLNYFFE